jgi:O-antigen/teichoic acid export membrane protein
VFSKLNAYNYGRIVSWVKLIGITGITQVFVQVLGFISGILIIRFLPIQEYALYTLANTMLGTMTLLADGGISTGVLSQGGKVWKDKDQLGSVLVTGLDLRKKFAFVSLIISLPVLIYLLIHHNASWLMALLIACSLMPAFYAQLSDSILVVVPKLHQDITRLQKNEALVGLGRLLCTISFIFIYPFTYLALLATGIPRIYGNFKLVEIAKPFANFTQNKDPQIRKKILSTVKRMLPGIIYYCLSGQITIWLISILGSTTSLAQLGALSKLAVFLSIFSSLTGTLIVPRFARLKEEKRKLFWFYIQTILVIFFMLCAVIALVSLFPVEILELLGNNYETLGPELILTIVGSAINLLAGIAFSLNVSRDWVLNPIISISVSVLSIIIGIMFFDVSTLKGVLLYNVFLAIIQLLMNGAYSFYKLIRIQ